MAQRTTVLLTDDLDGSEAVETVSFAVDGRQFEIDLNAEHAADIREMLQLYVEAARQVGGGRSGSPSRTPRTSAATTDGKAMRAWAKAKGYEVSPRGRIPREIVEAYEASH